jgi:hypothetical protein
MIGGLVLIATAPVYAQECEMADNIFKRWTSKWVRELDASGASLSEIAGVLAQTEAAHVDRKSHQGRSRRSHCRKPGA